MGAVVEDVRTAFERLGGASVYIPTFNHNPNCNIAV